MAVARSRRPASDATSDPLALATLTRSTRAAVCIIAGGAVAEFGVCCAGSALLRGRGEGAVNTTPN
eukprot:7385112-Prymnesium_polylepis.1